MTPVARPENLCELAVSLFSNLSEFFPLRVLFGNNCFRSGKFSIHSSCLELVGLRFCPLATRTNNMKSFPVFTLLIFYTDEFACHVQFRSFRWKFVPHNVRFVRDCFI